jgi:hypothetical protein
VQKLLAESLVAFFLLFPFFLFSADDKLNCYALRAHRRKKGWIAMYNAVIYRFKESNRNGAQSPLPGGKHNDLHVFG